MLEKLFEMYPELQGVPICFNSDYTPVCYEGGILFNFDQSIFEGIRNDAGLVSLFERHNIPMSPKYAMEFALLHELGHWFLHYNGYSAEEINAWRNPFELQLKETKQEVLFDRQMMYREIQQEQEADNFAIELMRRHHSQIN